MSGSRLPAEKTSGEISVHLSFLPSYLFLLLVMTSSFNINTNVSKRMTRVKLKEKNISVLKAATCLVTQKIILAQY